MINPILIRIGSWIVVSMILWIPFKLSNMPDTYTKPFPVNTSSPSVSERVWGLSTTEEDINCLALNIYFEARGEPTVGQYAVTEVVLNRVLHADFPNDICSVVFFRNTVTCAFSWTCDGKSTIPKNKFSMRKAIAISREVLYDWNYEPIVPNALFYHAVYVQPEWSRNKLKYIITKIGDHIFYGKGMYNGIE